MTDTIHDLEGRRFGSLVAVQELRRERGGVVWLCSCDCGRMAEALAPALRHGSRVSCGCARRKVRIDLSGRRYGRWRVLRPAAHNARGPAAWLCRCACGTERILSHRALQQRRTFSCGCSPRGRPRGTGDPALIRRDQDITAARLRGETLRALAARHGISPQRVQQITTAAGLQPSPNRRRA